MPLGPSVLLTRSATATAPTNAACGEGARGGGRRADAKSAFWTALHGRPAARVRQGSGRMGSR
jgi:hypothetical protein